MKNIAVGTSPINGVIYAGKLNKAGDMWVGDKQDITDMATSAVAESLLITKESLIFAYGSGEKRKRYKLTIVNVED